MKKSKERFLVFMLISCSFISIAQNDTFGLSLDFLVFDLPYQVSASESTKNPLSVIGSPSMQQSLALSNDLYTLAHWGAKSLIKSKSEFLEILLEYGAIASFDLLSLSIPLGSGWLHEEYHRSIMTLNGVSSFNEINTFPFGKELVAVRNIEDAALAKFADENSIDFTRLMSSGIEATYHQVRSLQTQNFFSNQDLPHIPLYWLNTFNGIFYVNESGSAASFDELIDERNELEATDVASRDFTGPDLTAWVFELFNPENPYLDRGIHPGGIGLDRYVKPSSLSTDELNYLQQQGNLQWLNLLSPHLFGFPKFRLKSGTNGKIYGSFAVRHLLTSFGNDLSFDFFIQTPKHNLIFTLHNYNNLEKGFVGLEGNLIDEGIFQDRLLLSSRAMLWTQPENQSFFAEKGNLGGALWFQASIQQGRWRPYLEIDAKSQGWILGNVYLDPNLSIRMGVKYLIDLGSTR